ncbi:MAG: alpha/beta fold hydrolase [Pseudomonadota bacterium]
MPRVLIAIVSLAVAACATAKPPPKSIEALRAAERNVELVEVGPVDGGEGFDASLWAYDSAGLKVHALVARPLADPPDGGWPVVIANHGHHPDPPQFGITAEGKDHRPGDYYRRIPELFVARGYLVVMPDYRGHNSSEGFEYTEGMLESAYYTEDVVNLVAAVGNIPDIDTDQLYMWGHSMGGEVTLRTLLVTNRIRAATMWSSVGGDVWDQSYYYSRYADPMARDGSDVEKYVVPRLRGRIAELNGPFDTESVEPYNYLDDLETPIIIQHAVGDTGAAYKWSARLAKELYVRGKDYEFWSFEGSNHLFSPENMEIAADRDAAFFRRNSSD